MDLTSASAIVTGGVTAWLQLTYLARHTGSIYTPAASGPRKTSWSGSGVYAKLALTARADALRSSFAGA